MLKQLLLENRTCRTFDQSRTVTRAELLEMVDCARITPSSMNMQPLCYRLVYERDEVEALLAHTKWGGALPDLKLPPDGHHPAAFIVICQDTEKFGSADKFNKDVGICALAIQLAACEMGLAGCMIGSFSREKAKATLKLSENVEPLLVIGIGKPDEARKIVPVVNGSTKYYREDGVHIVPKRSLEDIVL